MKKTIGVILCVMFMIAWAMFVAKAVSYEYDGEIDPVQFFSYEVIDMERVGGNKVILHIKNKTVFPRCALNLVISNGKMVLILSYAYLDLNGDLKCYALKGSRYVPMPMTPNIAEELKGKLYRLNGIKNDV